VTVRNTGVVSAATNGLAIVVLVSLGLRNVLQLSAVDIVRGTALFVFIVVFAVRYLPAYHPFPLYGPANQITTLRAALVSLAGGFVGAPETAIVAATAAGIALLVTALDGVDGWFARRTGMASAFGARFDMEVDALLILVLALLAWTHGKAPSWVVWSGVLRYLFVLAGWLARWMRAPLPPSRRRQTVCVVQVAALIAVVLPQIQPPLSVRLAAAALALLVYSFAVDVWWLWRHRLPVRVPVHP
jgi:phosphatidylglycerophosphate synthase